MEFDEMKKIWDTQSNVAMYAIDEEALHNRVISKRNKAARNASKMEGILIFSLLFASGIIWSSMIFKANYELPSLVLSGIMLVVAGAIFLGRRKRMSWQNGFENTMLGDIDQAIANASYQVALSKSSRWLYLTVSVFAVLSVFNEASEWWKGLLVTLFFIVGYFAARWEHKTFYVSQKRSLETVRKKLLQFQEEGNVETGL
jgi:hypothetical protein